MAGTDSCQAHHLGVVQSGQISVQHEDGSEFTCGPGDTYEIKSGHQAQVVGDEPCVMIEFDSQLAEIYAKGSWPILLKKRIFDASPIGLNKANGAGGAVNRDGTLNRCPAA